MFNFNVTRSSDAIVTVYCDLINKFTMVTFKNGSVYAYRGVSRRAMLNLYYNKNISLGFWVNENCVNNAPYYTEVTKLVPTFAGV